MPVFEMPLEQLKRYQGRNPKPDDFDAYWHRALSEMRSIDPQVELIPHPTKASFAECFDLYFTGVGGSRVYAKYLRPKAAPKPHPALLMFHGYSGSSGDWTDKLPYVAQGFAVAALDCRGQGGRSENIEGVRGPTLRGHIIRGLDDHPDKLYYRAVFLDTAQLANIVMSFPEIDADRVGATGGSQGGALTLACAALEPRIRKAAPVFPFLCDYLRVWEMDLAVGAYEEIRTFLRQFDPRHEREQEIFTRLGYIDCQHLAPRIRAEVLMLTGLMDTICPPSTQFAAYNKIESPKRMILYPDYGHESLPDSADILFDFFADL
ncbi:acetyl esterase (deacetylase) [Chthonomonas calidirosea]|uniref:Acetyl esterase (Deacetylase) n=1 Tax=Chthonomonas calidirosea (strain DSM 23976 / ICMP 18418 / T49) TaxID=1303518 RepID=S0EVK8_CHTCT|nr:alpha/beta fold hydrolase [Chthonomonas calidirosea]CCW35839.1 Acetyl esterase (deacetylase) [Chthonomonas calidirosea T49]CEK18068.1 acetyl esterase (deacetylase) [Chthonomonas calidirosea]CEK19093.1 acetyl esterase (deacetylase) [Chthonomonas calidirosea]